MPNENGQLKLLVQKRIVIVSVLIFAAKIAAYFLTNSVGILTDALESIVNVVTGFVTVLSISISLKPHDKGHPFGHGKVESLSASLEGFLILLAGLIIIFEAIRRLFYPSEVEELGYGIVIIAVGGLLNYLLGWYSIQTGKKHKSIALVAGGKHLQSDTYSTIGLIIGLFLLWYTEIAWLDSAIAIVFGLIIIYTGFNILKETVANLMDAADFGIVKEISAILWKNKTDNWVEIHNMRMVKYGDIHHIDCDLVLPWYITVKQAHDESDKLKEVIQKAYPDPVDFTVHMDACFENLCHQCHKKDCTHRVVPHTDEDEWTVENITSKHSVHRFKNI